MNKALQSVNDHLEDQDANIDRLFKGHDHLWHLLQSILSVSPIYMIIEKVGHIEAYKLFPEKYIHEWVSNFKFSRPIIQFQSICRDWLMFRGCVNCFNGVNMLSPVEQSKHIIVDLVPSHPEDGWICISCGKFHLHYS